MLLIFQTQQTYALPDLFKEAYIEKGNYYVGNVFGDHDYKSNTNIKLNSYFIMNTEVTYRLYTDVRNWAMERGYLIHDGCNGSIYEDCRLSNLENTPIKTNRNNRKIC